jgi:hypothetical protein
LSMSMTFGSPFIITSYSFLASFFQGQLYHHYFSFYDAGYFLVADSDPSLS